MKQRIQLPEGSRSKLDYDEKEFAVYLYEYFNLPVEELAYNPHEDWVELSDRIWWDEETVVQVFEDFEPDPLYGMPQWKRRLAELLDREDELTEEEERELKKLERRQLRQML